MKPKVLVSVYNISGYLIAELEELSKVAEIAVIETPCTGIGKGTLEETAKWIDRTKLKSEDEVEAALGDFKPDIFLCGGWADKLMVRFARTLRQRGVKTVLMIDTPWQGRLKQFVHCCYSRFYLPTTYDFAWGAGEPQARYLHYLGFPKSRIRTGVYCADTKKFAPIGEARFGIGKEEKGKREWRHCAEQKVEEWLVGVTRESFDVALDRLIDEKVAIGEYRFKSGEDQSFARAGARRFFDEFSRKIIQLSDGRCVYFSPDARAKARNGSDLSRCWAEYAFHAISSSGKILPGKNYGARHFNADKSNAVSEILRIIRAEICGAALIDGQQDKDAVVFLGESRDVRKRIEVITRIDYSTQGLHNLTEVTVLIKNARKKTPPIKPLSEVVEAVERHQGAGYLPSTNTNSVTKLSAAVNGGKGEGLKWPRVFLYIGRYVPVKNMRRMERAFLKAIEQMSGSDWKLRCIGGGALWSERTIHPAIEHLGYKSPDEIQDYVRDAGCFVLPSLYEPWGVVVHEAALMGLPMLCSDRIQAATAYLKDGENGFTFDPLDEAAMTAAFRMVMQRADENLVQMGRESFKLGMFYKNSDWARTVLEMMK